MMPAIQVKYSCFKCGIYRRTVTVPQRTDSQDVMVWMETVCAPALSRDHDQRAPGCTITEFNEVLIPIPEEIGRVGTLPPLSSLPSGAPSKQTNCHICGECKAAGELMFKGMDEIYRTRLYSLPGDKATCRECMFSDPAGGRHGERVS